MNFMSAINIPEILNTLITAKEYHLPEHLTEQEIAVLIDLLKLNLKRSQPFALLSRQDNILLLL